MRRYILALAMMLPFWQPLARPALAQAADSASITFGGLKGDPKAPVTVTSESLTVDETARTAVFTGNVLVVQGEMRLSAAEVRVEYEADADRIARLWATGGVLLVNATDAAQSQKADYVIDTGIVTMTDEVVLTQGPATFTAQTFVADMKTGLGQLQGGVRSTFVPNAEADSQTQKAVP
jgi:lipopolysaccharide export system protein LptA